MDDTKSSRSNQSIHDNNRNRHPKAFDLAFPTSFVQIPERLQNCLKLHFKKLVKNEGEVNSVVSKEKESQAVLKTNLDKQLNAWKENPTWVDKTPKIKVSVPKGSLCNLKVNVKVGLPPDAVYDIVTDPDNRRVFKNIKEVISRQVLVDEGSRQVVELEQAALWRFLWWSGTISVHVMVDQNREDHSMKFKQVKTGFMKRFEGCWRVEPLFVDEQLCSPFKPKTWADYDLCTRSKGRVGSIVTLEQLIEPALVPPPPISWYLRGITTRTTEMLITDLLAESARIRGDFDTANFCQVPEVGNEGNLMDELVDVKERWTQRRKNGRGGRTNRRMFQRR